MSNSALSFANLKGLPKLAEDSDQLKQAKKVCEDNFNKVQAYIKAYEAEFKNHEDIIQEKGFFLGLGLALIVMTAVHIALAAFLPLSFIISVAVLAISLCITYFVLTSLAHKRKKNLELQEGVKIKNIPLFHYIECVKLGDPDFLKTLGKNNKVDKQVKVPNLNGRIINLIKRSLLCL
jgi:hypothetical protein